MESLLLTLFLLARLFGLGAAGSTNSTDYLALLSFKSLIAVGDPALAALASWGNLSVPVCRWRGVACGVRGRRRGRVVALDLPELGLQGTVPPELGNLTYLRQLNLSYNQLHGVLPPELGNLAGLSDLDLRGNSLQGRIPESLSNCTHLENLVLYGNEFHGEIPEELCLLHNLKVLNLGMNFLTGSIPMGIGGLVSLTFLNLQLNNLTGEIPQQIGGLVKLVKLGVGHNQLTGPIPASLGNLSALKILSIFQTRLTGTIPPLQNLSSLELLELSSNNLTGSIPAWVGNLSSLTVLNIMENSLTGCIPESLGNLQSTTYLGLAKNKLSCSIPQSLENLGALQNLFLESNELEGSFPPLRPNLSSLVALNLRDNRLSGPLPPDIGDRLPNIQIFPVDRNQFHGTIPASLCNVSTLKLLQVTTNFFSGKIPRCLGIRQKRLVHVVLGENHLETRNHADWDFLSGLANITSMRTLDFCSNNLHGELPNSIGNLSSQMNFLNLAYNNLNGKIPEGIGNLIGLEWLYMAKNLFQGTIPASLGELTMLNQLDISDNNLSGYIPQTLGNLTSLNKLELRGNALHGYIPSSLSSSPLQLLDLSYNSLTGPIPKQLFLIDTLSISMILGHNYLSGTLPSEIGNLKNIGMLDFSSNNISGDIPMSIGKCQSLEYLNMSGNIFQGTIPSSLVQIKSLAVLDLSHNNFSGVIPAFLGSLGGLSTLNLSYNKFQGEVPQDGIFLNPTSVTLNGNDGLCGGIAHLKLQPCSHWTIKKASHKLVIIISVCAAVALIISVFALTTHYHRSRRTEANMQASLINEHYMRVSYAELANSTNGFAPENLLGAGSFGSVYKGTMASNDQQIVVAVKVLNLTQRGASQSFAAECETLRCVRHRNLVKILTVCSSIDFQGRDFKALVYEFLPNGNLDSWLHRRPMEDVQAKGLNLQARLQIATGVACSLEYLHQHKPIPIIHCDLKPSNVLLDSEMVAHVGDFGLARFVHHDFEKSSGWASMRGTIGYAAPEYGLGNEVTIQGDVYSYGILLLEMFTGKRPTDGEFGEALGLHKYAQMGLAGSAASVIDQQLLRETEDDEASSSNSGRTSRDTRIACISSILQVGIACSAEMPTDRVQIGDALKELQTVRDKFEKQLLREGEPRN